MTMTLTNEEIKMLEELNIGMDRGEINFVIYRIAVGDEIMEQLGLKNGQNISDSIYTRILELKIAECRAKIVISKAKE